MRKLFCLLFITVFFTSFADNWRSHWQNGLSLSSKSLFVEAKSEFDEAVALMEEKDLEKYPFVLVHRAENDRFLGNNEKALHDTEIALQSKNITQEERLICGLTRISIFAKIGEEQRALDEYKKYVIDCPLFPKYDFLEEMIIIRNIPSCECYKKLSRDFILAEYCENEKDLHEYGSTWIVDITKKRSCCQQCEDNHSAEFSESAQEKSIQNHKSEGLCKYV